MLKNVLVFSCYRKISVFVKQSTLFCTKAIISGGFRKCSSKWIFTKTGVFENAQDQCERTKASKNKNSAITTTQNTCPVAPLQGDFTKTEHCNRIKAAKKDIFPPFL